MELVSNLASVLLSLGRARLLALAIAAVSLFMVVGVASFLLSSPPYETIYSGLEPEDASRIGVVLSQSGTEFEIGSDGRSVLVPANATLRARMLLAENGLPRSPGAGYELFDNLGSLGLTSFMQDVTRVRALEGELSRTIQLIDGVKAARVHIVLPDRKSFKITATDASASVVIRLDRPDRTVASQAIRHLVASAVPELAVDRVSLMTTDGKVFAANGSEVDNGVNSMLGLEKEVSDALHDKISSTLAPQLGLENFRVSVVARLNMDRRQVNETTFDPESKVERSIKVIKESGNTKDAGSDWEASVETSLPEGSSDRGGSATSEERQRREETTNYEVSSKLVSTTSAGYEIRNLSIAVVINRKQLMETLGSSASPEAVQQRTKELEDLVVSAAGLQKDRGDALSVSNADFVEIAETLSETTSPGVLEFVGQYIGHIIQSATIIFVALLVTIFGIRPSLRQVKELELPASAVAPELMLARPSADLESESTRGSSSDFEIDNESVANELKNSRGRQLQRKLQQIVSADEEQALGVLRQWIHEAA